MVEAVPWYVYRNGTTEQMDLTFFVLLYGITLIWHCSCHVSDALIFPSDDDSTPAPPVWPDSNSVFQLLPEDLFIVHH